MTYHNNTCFYCRRRFSKTGRLIKTQDHVYPSGIRYPEKMIEKARLLGVFTRDLPSNRVSACFECNQDKAQLGPVKWLTLCPSEAGAEALRVLLLELGESPVRVERALKLRSIKP